ncbi:MAG: hypothetical protein ACKOSS_02485 [Planctomycetia bacterium]
MDAALPPCSACGAPRARAGARCSACGAWPAGVAWDRALYYGFAGLTAVAMLARCLLRRLEPGTPTLGELWQAWLHPLVVLPLALTGVYAMRVWRRR